ncbi:peptidoglycan DD-metalloendopeptidase family protein [Paenibacillus sp. HB172176]|uniref:murein hydrolase activator EnvC family protein n=1 Tax=Paenibacillus sp. HB172176 TaxID=2493690 RepID=UPI001438936C|nr:peptidoglycan DD-metalloendopeptidase family protein [Paenibacillus sp. HB172176]
MKKISVVLIIALLAAVMTIRPGDSGSQAEASSLSDIEKQIAAANQQMKDAQKKAAEAQEQASANKNQQQDLTLKKEDLQKQITAMIAEIDKVGNAMQEKQAEKEAKEAELVKTGEELDAAVKRVEERDALLQSRMRLMYSNGFVSYMDVLLSANSFSDFLDRFDALQTILNTDKDVLEEHKKDKALVEEKKEQVETQLADVKEIYNELQLQQADMVKKESEKEVLVASYNASIDKLGEDIDHLEDITEEQQKVVIALAAKKSKLEAEKNRIKNPYSGGTLAFPLKASYRVSSNFGMRVHPITGVKKLHTGIDLAVPQGTSVYAAEAGIVIMSQWTSGYGNCIIIDHGNGLWTLYAHLKTNGLLVEEGDSVKRGDLIAKSGNTGDSTGPHLHFEVRKNEVAVNPTGYLK